MSDMYLEATSSYGGDPFPSPMHCWFLEDDGNDGWSDSDMLDTVGHDSDGPKGADSVTSGAGSAGRGVPTVLHGATAAAGNGLQPGNSASNAVRNDARSGSGVAAAPRGAVSGAGALGSRVGARAGAKGRGSSMAAPRVRLKWTEEMQAQFLDAVDEIGVINMTGQKIIEKMHVDGLDLTRVRSRVNTYRLKLKREAGLPCSAQLDDENLLKMDLAHQRLRTKPATEDQARAMNVQHAGVPGPAPVAGVAAACLIPAPAAAAVLAAQGGFQRPLAGLAAWSGGCGDTLGQLAAPAAAIASMARLPAVAVPQALGLSVGPGAVLQLAAPQQMLMLGAAATSARGVMPPVANALPAGLPPVGGVPLVNGVLPWVAAGNAPGSSYGALASAAPPRLAAATIPVNEALQGLQRNGVGTAVLARGATAVGPGPGNDADAGAEEGAADEDGAGDDCAICGRRDSEGGFWIACDSCNSWFCGRCARMTKAKSGKVKKWLCFQCT